VVCPVRQLVRRLDDAQSMNRLLMIVAELAVALLIAYLLFRLVVR
jgi:hypothetical protein